MKRTFKIILGVSITLNLVLAGFQLSKHLERQKNIAEFHEQMKKYKEQRFVNVAVVKKNFFDTLFIKYPELIKKKYLFLNLWRTSDAWTDRTLPIYDTIIRPLRQDVGYLTVTDENGKYAKSLLKKDTSFTNFHYVYSSENLILAINQELKIPFKKFNYPRYPLNVIYDNQSKQIVFFDTVGISGPKYPEDSLADKKVIASIKKALHELK